jgi:ADP-ribose pyrophosphatase YjhB (NUDIX family)
MNFCSRCAAQTRSIIPANDNRLRHVCTECGEIHYENPKLVVGTVAYFNDKVLLCRRAIEPRSGKWTLPAGFMELNETTQEGALRETLEEAGAKVRPIKLMAVYDVVVANQVHLFYLAEMASESLDPGEESLEARLFYEHEIPWDEIAFRSVEAALRHFLKDRQVHYSMPVDHQSMR